MMFKTNKRLIIILKIILIELYIIVAQLIWNCRNYVLKLMITIPPKTLGDKILFYIYNGGLAIILSIILLAIIISLFRKNKEKERKGMEDIGLKNYNDETPRCVKIIDGMFENQKIYIFHVH